MKFVRLTLCSVVFVSVSWSDAQVAYVPNSATNTGACLDVPLRVSTGNARNQVIIPASFLPNTPVKITDVLLAACQTTNFAAGQMQVRMAHTTAPDFSNARMFDTNIGPCPTVLLDGPHQFTVASGAWSPIGLPCSFGYDGQRNLLVEIRYSGAGANGPQLRDGGLPSMFNSGYSPSSGPQGPNGVRMGFAYTPRFVLISPDTVSVGGTASIQVLNAGAGNSIQIAASQGQRPFSLGSCSVCLVVDGLFTTSTQVGPPVFVNYKGIADQNGAHKGLLLVPNLPALVGQCVYHAAVSFTSTVQGCTNTAGLTIVP